MLLAAGLLSVAAGSAWSAQPSGANKDLIKAHLSFLADDLLEGRETGSRGFDIAALYVAGQFAQFGVQPKGDKGGYLQAVPYKSTLVQQDSPLVEIISKSGTETLRWLDDYSMSGSLLEDQSSVTAPLVFVGYGIESDKFNHHDYANIDVKGKIVVMLQGRSKTLPTEEGAHYGNGENKRNLAAARGAVGVIALHTPTVEKVFPFVKNKDYRYIPTMIWVDKNGQNEREAPTTQNRIGMSMEAGKKLFAQSDVKLADIWAAIDAGKPLPHMDLGLSVHMAKKSIRSDVKGSNVIGVVEGSDPVLKNEYVVFSAHLDHLGIVKEKSGDNIYNGAMDNASGVSTLIETARLVAQMKVKPKRSILFVVVSGEEKGLLGADYFANFPTVPVSSIVADVNLDMPLLTYDFSNVVAFGAEHSSLKGSVAHAVKSINVGLMADPWPEQGLFTRSDHYMFVRKGIPSVFLATGLGSFNKTEDPAKLWDEFETKHYHQPSDDMNLPFNFAAAARFAQVNFNIGVEIANDKKRPSWNKGDFFGDLFTKK
jgi:hypothetical protein